MSALNKNQIAVDVMFLDDCSQYNILKITDCNENSQDVDTSIILMLEDDEDSIVTSNEFIEYMNETYLFDECTEFIINEIEEEYESGPRKEYTVEIYTIKDSFNFKILKVMPPDSKLSQGEYVAIDTDKIFSHLNNNRYNFPAELFDYIGNVYDDEINSLKMYFNYTVEGCEPEPSTGEIAPLVMPALRPS